MRILIVSTHDFRGGAGKAAYRFAKEFIKQGHEVCLYIKSRSEKDNFVKSSESSSLFGKFLHALDFVPGYVLSGFDNDCGFTLGLFGESLEKIVKEFKPDIINIHWTWKGFVSFPEICRVSRKTPVVWIMHDYSPFSGGMFYPGQKKKTLLKFLVNINNKIRKLFIKHANIIFVSPSKFLLKEFEKSELSKIFKGVVINNGVDQSVFRSRVEEEGEILERLNLDKNKKYILFGGMNLVDNEIKGGKVLQEVFKNLENFFIENNIGLLSYGSQNPFDILELNKKIATNFVGYIKTDIEMSCLISVCDIVLVPSLFENYPYAAVEPASCGIPVVAFGVGGIPEIVKDERMGYIVKPYDIEDFENSIRKLVVQKPMKYDKGYLDISQRTKEYTELFNNYM